MPEYISREAVLAQKGDCYDKDGHLLSAVGTGNILRIPAADVVERPRWIPVTERLPKDWRSVLVHCAAGEARWIQIADVVRGKWRLLPGYADAKVTHWMPLLEPPKEET